MNANIDAAYEVFADLAQRGVDYLKKIPAERAANSCASSSWACATWEPMKWAILAADPQRSRRVRLVEERTRNQDGGRKRRWPVHRESLSPVRERGGTANGRRLAIRSSPTSSTTRTRNGRCRTTSRRCRLGCSQARCAPCSSFLTWPYNAMRRFREDVHRSRGAADLVGRELDGRGRHEGVFPVAAPATIAGSFAIDWYDKYLLGKKQNLRETSLATAIPVSARSPIRRRLSNALAVTGPRGSRAIIINQIINLTRNEICRSTAASWRSTRCLPL
jgi:hypothetical protein